MFEGVGGEEDEDLELETAAEQYRKRGGVILGKNYSFTSSIVNVCVYGLLAINIF